MAERVTIQDIADELGVSRNTVSKAINNTGLLADSTRERVLQKAADMGYKQFSYLTLSNQKSGRLEYAAAKNEIALISTGFIGSSHFASTMLDKFQREISLLGYSLSIHRVSDDEIEKLQMPASFNKEKTAGLLCLELFHREYASMICGLGIPVLFVDSPVIFPGTSFKADCLYMENQNNIFVLIRELVRRGKKKIGFIGECMHCQSFFERYMAYRNAMHLLGLPCREQDCIIGNRLDIRNPDGQDYQEYLASCFHDAEDLPEVFLCANDFVALDALRVFKSMRLSVPEDIWLCGFDDSPESRIVTPALTTVHIHSQIMGFSAVHLLMSRIKQPALNFRTIHTETSLLYRESTGDGPKIHGTQH